MLEDAKCRCGNIPVALAGFPSAPIARPGSPSASLSKPGIRRSAWCWSAPPPVSSRAPASTTPRPCRTTPSSSTARRMRPCRSTTSSTGQLPLDLPVSSCPAPTTFPPSPARHPRHHHPRMAALASAILRKTCRGDQTVVAGRCRPVVRRRTRHLFRPARPQRRRQDHHAAPVPRPDRAG